MSNFLYSFFLTTSDYVFRLELAIIKPIPDFKLVVPCIVIQCDKNPTRCNSMQIFIYCKATIHVPGVTAPIIRSTKNCNRSLQYRS